MNRSGGTLSRFSVDDAAADIVRDQEIDGGRFGADKGFNNVVGQLSVFSNWRGWFSAQSRHEPSMPREGLATSSSVRAADDENHLIERKTIESIERENTRRAEDLREVDRRRSPERIAALLKPFGYSNGEWEALKTSMQPGDELWTFASSSASWRALAGRAGIALVRDGKIVATIITMRN
jgi:hypothetical protein